MKTFKDAIEFFNSVSGIYFRMREFHFNTHIEAEHNLTNSFMPSMMEYADAVMENVMGILDSRPGMDILTPTKCEETSINSGLKYLKSEVLKLRDAIQGDENYNGVVNILDDFTTDINKWIYLSRNK